MGHDRGGSAQGPADGGTVHRAVDRAAEKVARRRSGVVVCGGTVGAVHITGRGDDGDGATPHARTLFEIGSITKTFTALLLAVGIRRGLWRLDTPVREMLPAGTEVPDRHGARITLQHLTTHTSGLPRSPVRFGVRENVAYLARGADPYAGLTEHRVLAALGGIRPRREPGGGAPKYSNLGVGLLGSALTTATGLDFGTLVRAWICDPLGMDDTVTVDLMSPEQRGRLAAGHRSRRRTAEPWPLPAVAGAGALRSTPADMVRYLEAQVRPPDSELGEALRLTHVTPPGGPPDKGLGWHRAGADLLWHNGGTGGFRSIAILSPRTGHLVCVLVNQSRGADLTAFGLLRRLRD